MNLQNQQWEFGCIEWVEYAAGLGVTLFEQSGLDLSKFEWGFSEEYTHIPERNKDKTKRLRRSPELEDLPETDWGVPDFSRMTDEQKARFIELLG